MARRCRSIVALGLLIPCVVPINSAIGSETIAYIYDARGRLMQASHAGTVNNGVTSCYAYDKAGSRTNVTVATTSNCGAAAPSFSINDVLVTEGGALVFTVTKTGTTSSSFNVSYATANSSAVAGSDYTAASNTLTFAAAETSKTITISSTDDAVVEGSETFVVNLSGATGGATITKSQGIGTITDNDTASPPSFSINNRTGTEGGSLIFTVTKTGSTSSSYSVNYATANGTATSTSDYVAASGTLTFGPTDTSKTITIATRNNTLVEVGEYFYVNLSGATGGSTISDAQGVGTIDDDDEDPCPTC